MNSRSQIEAEEQVVSRVESRTSRAEIVQEIRYSSVTSSHTPLCCEGMATFAIASVTKLASWQRKQGLA